MSLPPVRFTVHFARLHTWVLKCARRWFGWFGWFGGKQPPIVRDDKDMAELLRHQPTFLQLERRKAPTALSVANLVTPPYALLGQPSRGTTPESQSGPTQPPGSEQVRAGDPGSGTTLDVGPGDTLLSLDTSFGNDLDADGGEGGVASASAGTTTTDALQPPLVDSALSQAYSQALASAEALLQSPLAADGSGGGGNGPGPNSPPGGSPMSGAGTSAARQGQAPAPPTNSGILPGHKRTPTDPSPGPSPTAPSGSRSTPPARPPAKPPSKGGAKPPAKPPGKGGTHSGGGSTPTSPPAGGSKLPPTSPPAGGGGGGGGPRFGPLTGLTVQGTGFTLTEGVGATSVVATFTDASHPSTTAADYTATITWDASHTAAGAITSDGQGHFTVRGSYTFAEEGTDTVSVRVTAVTLGETATAQSTAYVLDGALTGSGGTVQSKEAQPFSGKVASFTDANPNPDLHDLSATIRWGDNTTPSAGTITANGQGGFDVTGAHTYANGGEFLLTVTVTDAGGSFVTISAVGLITDEPLQVTGKPLTATEDTAANNVTVATFVDPDGGDTTASYTALVNWGDNSPKSTATIVGSGSTFSVVGSHTYHEGSGSSPYTLNIQVNEKKPGGSAGAANTTATVADLPLHPTGLTGTAIEGIPFSGLVATFTDSDTSPSLVDFSAQIDWGDGKSSKGTVVQAGSTFNVIGQHQYKEENTYQIHTTVVDAHGSTATATGTALVGDANLTAFGVGGFAPEGQAAQGTLATFLDANTLATAADFSATIIWGDGTPNSAGTVKAKPGGGFSVVGSHTYAEEGSATATISIYDDGGSRATAVSAIVILDSPLKGVGRLLTPTENTSGADILATFSDTSSITNLADYHAAITWQGGATATGQVVPNTDGGFNVVGSWNAGDEGTTSFYIAITDDAQSVGVYGYLDVVDGVLTITEAPVFATESTTYQGNFASFSLPDPSPDINDLTATLTWSDGTSEAGTVVPSGGGFEVVASRSFTEEGTDLFTVSVSDHGGSTVRAVSYVRIVDAPLTLTDNAPTVTENQDFSGKVGSFTDANANPQLDEFKATIDWGDGTVVEGTITKNGSGGFDVLGEHHYNEEGGYTLVLTAEDSGGAVANTAVPFTVGDAGLTATAYPVHSTEGQEVTATVATFTDANLDPQIDELSATISWGDGTTEEGTIEPKIGGGFAVIGAHTYAEENQYSLSVRVHDEGGNTVTAAATATVRDAQLHGDVFPIDLTEGESFSGTLAFFTDDNPFPQLADLSATIDWGDGSVQAEAVSSDGADGFIVLGQHSWADEGTYEVNVTVEDKGTRDIITDEAWVDDAPLTATHMTGTATEGVDSTVTLATFTDGNPSATLDDFRATVDWCDGTAEEADVKALASGTYAVVGVHAYAEEGMHDFHVLIEDFGGSTAEVTDSVTVQDAPLAGSGTSLTYAPGQAFATTVAAFDDSDINGTVRDYSATITWGDGSTEEGTIVSDFDTGLFDVVGAHTYEDLGPYTIKVHVKDAGGSAVDITSSVTVTDTPPEPVDPDLVGAVLDAVHLTEGQAVSSVVAWFSDYDTYYQPTLFQATINWGDGNITPGSITPYGMACGCFSSGGYDVDGAGNHTYAEEGNYTISVVITDQDGHSTTLVGTATVGEPAFTINPVRLSTFTEPGVYNGPVASFAAPDADPQLSEMSATIEWGDNSIEQGTIVSGGGGYQVVGSHTFEDEGTYAVNVTVWNNDASAEASTNVTLNDASLNAVEALDVTATEGAQDTYPLGRFTDNNPSAVPEEYNVAVTWGDNSTGGGTVVDEGDGTFVVLGTHDYNEAGDYSITVTVTDNTDSVTFDGTAAVEDARLLGADVSFSMTESESFTAAQVIASFDDLNHHAPVSDYTAYVDWGDGSTPVQAAVTANPDGGFDVVATPTYGEEDQYDVVVTITDKDGETETVESTVDVVDASLTATTVTDLTLNEGDHFNGQVATLVDDNPSPDLQDFTAVIDWGDGTVAFGSFINQGSGTLAVQGDHIYDAGEYFIDVTIVDSDGDTTVYAEEEASVAEVTFTATTLAPTASEGVAFTNAVAHITDNNVHALPSDYAITIDWGDGEWDYGSATAQGGGNFNIGGTHYYEETGTYVATIDIEDIGGDATTVESTVYVVDASLSLTPTPITVLESVTFSGTVATLTDANTDSDDADLAATVVWGGGGGSELATLVPNDQGGYDVVAEHAWPEEGAQTFQVIVHDRDGATATTNGTAQVLDAPWTSALLGQTATVNQPFNGVVAQFLTDESDTDNVIVAASINWGDGVVTAGTATPDGHGGVAISGTHLYAQEGPGLITVSITDIDGRSATTRTPIVVRDPTLAVAVRSLGLTEGSMFNGQVASFSDGTGSKDPDSTELAATIDWGDGTVGPGTLTTTNSKTYKVLGSHAYTEGAGQYLVRVTVTDGPRIAGGFGIANVTEGQVKGTAAKLTLTEGSAFTGSVATFSDPNPNANPAEMLITIDWADGAVSDGTAVPLGNGQFNVVGTHLYEEEDKGSIEVSVRDADGTSIVASKPLVVVDAPLTLVDPQPTLTEGVEFTGVLGTFTDATNNPDILDYEASITWSDGGKDLADISPNDHGGYDIIGTTTFEEEGLYPYTIRLVDAGGASVVLSGQLTVQDAPLTGTETTVTAFEEQSIGTVVASFNDENGNPDQTDLSATINWGDGTVAPGTLQPNATGGFDVWGSHTYAEEGDYLIGVTLDDLGGSTAFVESHGHIQDASLTPAVDTVSSTGTMSFTDTVLSYNAVTATEGFAFTDTLAAFNDNDPSATVTDFAATIDWGDGTWDFGTVSATPSGSFVVIGSHSYQDEGVQTVTVTATDEGGSEVTLTGFVGVNDAPLTATGVSLTLNEGVTYSGPVASFSDANPNASASDFIALIDWGDGQYDFGTVTADCNCGFQVVGTHAYNEEGAEPVISVFIEDIGLSTASALSSVTVQDAQLNIVQATLSALESNVYNGVVATFTDDNAHPDINDFSASITWPDGQVTAGTITQGFGGSFEILGSHSLGEEGTSHYHVTVWDLGGSSASATGLASLNDQALTLNPLPYYGLDTAWYYGPWWDLVLPVPATEGNAFSATLMEFGDEDPNNTLSDYTASVWWGDGTIAPATVQTDGHGGYWVVATHSYAEEGLHRFSVVVRDKGGASAFMEEGISVSDAALHGQGGTISAPGDTYSGPVATFTDDNPSPELVDFSATINWGDGSSSTGSVALGGGNKLVVSGSHTWAADGSYPVDVYLFDVQSQASVCEVAQAGSGNLVIGTPEYSTYSGAVATFTASGSNVTFSYGWIYWGDGGSSQGTVSGGNGSYVISGTHFYNDECCLPVTASATGTIANTITNTYSETFTYTSYSTTEVFSTTTETITNCTTTTLSTSGTLTHTLTHALKQGSASSSGCDCSHHGYTLTALDSPSAGSLASPLGGGQGSTSTTQTCSTTTTVITITSWVTNTYTYTSVWTFTSVTVSDTFIPITVHSAAFINDRPISAVGPAPVTATEGASFTSILGSFYDSTNDQTSFYYPDGDYQVVVDWGDGTRDVGNAYWYGYNCGTSSYSLSHGTFNVCGTHIYEEEGAYTVHVTAIDDGGDGPRATFTETIAVQDASLSGTGNTHTVMHGQTLDAILATFTDADPHSIPTDYWIKVDWGDGTSSSATVEEQFTYYYWWCNGYYGYWGDSWYGYKDFIVDAQHSYADEGTYAVTVHVHDYGGATTDITSSVAVRMQVVGGAAFGIENKQLSGAVATIVDADSPGAVQILWGDGSAPSAGTVTPSGGNYVVSGSHTYKRAGDYAVAVQVNDGDAPQVEYAAGVAIVFDPTDDTLLQSATLASASGAAFNLTHTESTSTYSYQSGTTFATGTDTIVDDGGTATYTYSLGIAQPFDQFTRVRTGTVTFNVNETLGGFTLTQYNLTAQEHANFWQTDNANDFNISYTGTITGHDDNTASKSGNDGTGDYVFTDGGTSEAHVVQFQDDSSGRNRLNNQDANGDVDGQHEFGSFTVFGGSVDNYNISESGNYLSNTYSLSAHHLVTNTSRKAGNDRGVTNVQITVATNDHTNLQNGLISTGAYPLTLTANDRLTLTEEGQAVGGLSAHPEAIVEKITNTSWHGATTTITGNEVTGAYTVYETGADGKTVAHQDTEEGVHPDDQTVSDSESVPTSYTRWETASASSGDFSVTTSTTATTILAASDNYAAEEADTEGQTQIQSYGSQASGNIFSGNYNETIFRYSMDTRQESINVEADNDTQSASESVSGTFTMTRQGNYLTHYTTASDQGSFTEQETGTDSGIMSTNLASAIGGGIVGLGTNYNLFSGLTNRETDYNPKGAVIKSTGDHQLPMTVHGQAVAGPNLVAKINDQTFLYLYIPIPIPFVAMDFYVSLDLALSLKAGIAGGINPPFNAFMGEVGAGLKFTAEAGLKASGFYVNASIGGNFDYVHELDNLGGAQLATLANTILSSSMNLPLDISQQVNGIDNSPPPGVAKPQGSPPMQGQPSGAISNTNFITKPIGLLGGALGRAISALTGALIPSGLTLPINLINGFVPLPDYADITQTTTDFYVDIEVGNKYPGAYLQAVLYSQETKITNEWHSNQTLTKTITTSATESSTVGLYAGVDRVGLYFQLDPWTSETTSTHEVDTNTVNSVVQTVTSDTISTGSARKLKAAVAKMAAEVYAEWGTNTTTATSVETNQSLTVRDTSTTTETDINVTFNVGDGAIGGETNNKWETELNYHTELNQSKVDNSTETATYFTTDNKLGSEALGTYLGLKVRTGGGTEWATETNLTDSVTRTTTSRDTNVEGEIGNHWLGLSANVATDFLYTTTTETEKNQTDSITLTETASERSVNTDLGRQAVGGDFTIIELGWGNTDGNEHETNGTKTVDTGIHSDTYHRKLDLGNSIRGPYGLHEVQQETSTETPLETNQSLTITASNVAITRSTTRDTGNSITGDYTVATGEEDQTSDTSRETNQTRIKDVTTTVTTRQDSLDVGNVVSGSYTLDSTSTNTTNETSVETNQQWRQEMSNSAVAITTTSDKGNEITGAYTLTTSETDESTQTLLEVNQTDRKLTTETVRDETTTTDQGNQVRQDYTLTVTGTTRDKSDILETNQSLTVTSTEGVEGQTSSTDTGNDISGTYTLNSTDVNTRTELRDETNQSVTIHATGTVTVTTINSDKGNLVTADYTLTTTERSTSTDTSTEHNQTDDSTATSTVTDQSTSTDTGNEISGTYTLDGTDTQVTKETSYGANQSMTTTAGSTATLTVTSHDTGNQILGAYTLTTTELNSSTDTSTENNQTDDTTVTATVTGRSTSTDTGNEITGPYTLDTTSTKTTSESSYEKNQSLTITATSTLRATETSHETGNQINTDYTITATAQSTSTDTSTEHNQCQDTTVSGTVTTASTTTETASGATGAYTLYATESTSGTETISEHNQTKDGTVSTTVTSQSTSTDTGNDFTGVYTLDTTDTQTTTETSYEKNQSLTTTAGSTATVTTTSHEEGNLVVGDYRLTTSEQSNRTETITEHNQTEQSTVTTTVTSQNTGTDTGNDITGSYTLDSTATDTTTDSTLKVNQSLTVTANSTATHTVTTSDTGNQVIGDYTLATTDNGTTTETSTETLLSQQTTVTSTITVLAVSNEVGNNVAGSYTLDSTDTNNTTDNTLETNQSLTVNGDNTGVEVAVSHETGNQVVGDYTLAIDTTNNATETSTEALLSRETTVSSTVVSQGTTTETGNSVCGNYTLTTTETGTTNETTSEHNQTDDSTVSTTITSQSTITDTGNEVTGSYTLDSTDTNSTAENRLDTNQSLTLMASSTSGETATNHETGNSVIGAYTLTVTSNHASTETTTETNQTNASTVSTTVTGTSTSTDTGNEVTGSYTLHGSNTNTTTESRLETNLSLTVTSSSTASETQTEQDQGNSVNTDYTLTLTGNSTSTETSTETNQSQATTITATVVGQTSSTDTGNEATGTYTLHSTDTNTTTESRRETNQSLTVTAGSTATDVVTTNDQGNSVNTDYTLTLTGDSTTHETITETNQSVASTVVDTVIGHSSSTETGNEATGTYTLDGTDTNTTTGTDDQTTISSGSSLQTLSVHTNVNSTVTITTTDHASNRVTGSYTLTTTENNTDQPTITETDQSLSATTTRTATGSRTTNENRSDFTGAYTLTVSSTETTTETRDETNQSLAVHVQSTATETVTSTDTGNEITADYTLTDTSSGYSSNARTETNQGSATTLHTTVNSGGTTTETGNQINSDYTLTSTENDTTTEATDKTNQGLSVHVDSTNTAASTSTDTGNLIAADYTLHREETDNSYRHEHDTVTSLTVDASETGSVQSTVDTTGNEIAGTLTTTETDSSNNTRTENDTNGPLNVNLTVNTTGARTTTETGNANNADYTLTTTDGTTESSQETDSNQGLLVSLNSTVTTDSTTTDTGNEVASNYTLSTTADTTTSSTRFEQNQGAQVQLQEDATGSSTTKERGHSIPGDKTVTVTDSSTNTQTETDSNQGLQVGRTATLTDVSTTTDTGNDITGTYTLTVSDKSTNVATQTDQNQDLDLNTDVTITNSATTTETGNLVTGDYTRTLASGQTLTSTQTGANAAYAISVKEAAHDSTTQTITGNDVSGTQTLVTVSGQHDSTTTETDSYTDGGALSRTTTVKGTDDRSGSGNSISGDYTRTQHLLDTVTVQESGTRAGTNYTLTNVVTTTSRTLTQTGNDVSGKYSLTQIQSTDESDHRTGNDGFDRSATTHDDQTVWQSGNAVSGTYSQTQTDTYQGHLNNSGAGGPQVSQYQSGSLSLFEGGNAVTGQYGGQQTGTETTTLTESAANGLLVSQLDVASVQVQEFGNRVSGQANTVKQDTDRYTLSQTGGAASGTLYTLTETGVLTDQVQWTLSDLGGNTTLSQSGTDSYTLQETGSTPQLTDFTQTVKGTETGSFNEAGNLRDGWFSRSGSASGTYNRSETGHQVGIGAFTTSDSGSDNYTVTETSDPQAASLSLNETGTDRYALLQVEVDGSQAKGANGKGTVDFSPFGKEYLERGIPKVPHEGGNGPVDAKAVSEAGSDAAETAARGLMAAQEQAAYLSGGGLAQVDPGSERTGGDVQHGYAELGPALYMQSCFAARTPLLTPEGSRYIEEIRPGDRVLARSDVDPSGAVEARVVEEVFTNFAPLLHLHVRDQVIRTTPMHPFYVRGRGWVPASDLRVGDLLSSHDGQWVAVQDLYDTGEYETVYNLRVADFHTYFVAGADWGWSAWAHNKYSGTYGDQLSNALKPLGYPETGNAAGENKGYGQKGTELAGLIKDAGEMAKTTDQGDAWAKLFSNPEFGVVPALLAMGDADKAKEAVLGLAQQKGLPNPIEVKAQQAADAAAATAAAAAKAKLIAETDISFLEEKKTGASNYGEEYVKRNNPATQPGTNAQGLPTKQLEHIDPYTNKPAWANEEDLQGDHVLPQTAVEAAVKQFVGQGGKLTDELKKEILDQMNGPENLRPMPNEDNTIVKNKYTAEGMARQANKDTPTRNPRKMNADYVEGVRKIQTENAKKLQDTLNKALNDQKAKEAAAAGTSHQPQNHNFGLDEWMNQAPVPAGLTKPTPPAATP
jgi:hypothetical protein